MSADRPDPPDRRDRPAGRRRVALLGFGDFERDALASYFRLARARGGDATWFSYRPERALERCDFIVAVSDHAPSVQTVSDAGRQADTVFVGHRRPEGAGAWLARPIEPTRIVRELDGLAEQRQMVITVPGALDAPRRRRHAAPAVDLDPTEAAPPAADAAEPAAAAVRVQRRAVVAEASAGALAAVAGQLRERGYAVEAVVSGEAAVAAVAAAACDLALLDAALGADGALDGFETCQRLRTSADAERAPKIVIVGSLGGQADRVRALLAGCDAYVAAPLAADALDAVLRQLGSPSRRVAAHPGAAATRPDPG